MIQRRLLILVLLFTGSLRAGVELEVEPVRGAVGYRLQVEREGRLERDQRISPGRLLLDLPAGIVWVRVGSVNKIGQIQWSAWHEMRVGLLPVARGDEAFQENDGSVVVRGSQFLPQTLSRLYYLEKEVPASLTVIDDRTLRIVPEHRLEKGEYTVRIHKADTRMSPLLLPLTVRRGPCRERCPAYDYLVPGLPSTLRWEWKEAALWGGTFMGLVSLSAYSLREADSFRARRNEGIRQPASFLFLDSSLHAPLALLQAREREALQVKEKNHRQRAGGLFLFSGGWYLWHAYRFSGGTAQAGYDGQSLSVRFTMDF
ncbi:MAG: hypothetical protein HS115_09320 [Spirochaetales bacterium]|nr:hypothetical protein [Spirochaetales bacterium]